MVSILDGARSMSANADKIDRDQLEARVVAGFLRTETDPKKLIARLDDRVDLDFRNSRGASAGARLRQCHRRPARTGRTRGSLASGDRGHAGGPDRRPRQLPWRCGVDTADPVFHIVHEVPGRVRLQAATLKGDAGACAAAEACLSELTGLLSAQANPMTGSLTIVHEGSAASRKTVMRAIERFSRAPVEGEVPHPVIVPAPASPPLKASRSRWLKSDWSRPSRTSPRGRSKSPRPRSSDPRCREAGRTSGPSRPGLQSKAGRRRRRGGQQSAPAAAEAASKSKPGAAASDRVAAPTRPRPPPPEPLPRTRWF